MSERDIFLVEVSRRGRDSSPAPVDYATLRADVAALKARPVIERLLDIGDLVGEPGDGNVLLYDAATETWVPGPAASPLAVLYNGPVITADTNELYFWNGLEVTSGGSKPRRANISPVWGGTGSAAEVAHADHWHTMPSTIRVPFGPGGYLSSGSRPLQSTTVTLAAGVTYSVEATVALQMRGGDPGPCYYRLSVTIEGNTRQSPSGTDGYWCVQGVPDKTSWEHSRTLTGTGAAITVSAAVAYGTGGGGSYTDAGELIVKLRPDR